MKEKIVVLTGAGISAESGLKTFRDADGLWEGHDVMEVASIQGFIKNPELVLDFYNQRRQQLQYVLPNKAHKALADLETYFDVSIITQNVDDLHERAGSTNVLHLHGELLKVRSTRDASWIQSWNTDLHVGQTCPKGHQLRPHIVWFGEEVPELENAIQLTQTAKYLLIIGTSMQVYPAASLIHYTRHGIPIYVIDPKPVVDANAFKNLTVFSTTAVEGVPKLAAQLISSVN
ncbi:NAD-dependent deacylase [Arenibacter sp. GZD96]|uniref:SIR2 family NAD-dependent protein deacylase n=1 Tax=Aurantibrevibacter litoralis TaxID=3106030 RepID=UPI002AFF8DA1|nr:NAD-dependent deacylase [Arenibacter sp. GZD-96]MEA1786899.1 NAD-dependent deacylase [Arenibacter sp. GZD-96]